MAKSIRSKSDLPKWFKLSNYAALRTMKPVDWSQQLMVRSAYLFWLKHKAELSLSMTKGSAYLKLVQSARKNPIIDVSKFEDDVGAGLGHLKRIENKQELEYVLGVAPMNAWQLYNAYHRLPLKLRKDIEKIYSQEKSFITPKTVEKGETERKSINKRYAEALNELNFWGLDTLKVDLRFPDTVLIQQFENYLRKRRKTSHFKNSTYIKLDTKKWAKYNLLAYIDLLIWSLETETPITRKVYADTLYGNDTLNSETIRKTLEQVVAQIISRDHADIYSSIIASQIP